MNTRFLPALSLVGFCFSATATAASPQDFLIVPGHSIGRTALGPNGAAELKRLPPPAAQDNGMMQTRDVWVSRHSGRTDTLFIHDINNGVFDNVKPADGVTLDTIRITSPQFHTQNGLSTRSTFAEIRRCFPHVRDDHFHPQLYVDARRGIAFEFKRPVKPASQCIAITVFSPTKETDQAPPTQSQVDGLLKDSPIGVGR
jgi:hypothetical protein